MHKRNVWLSRFFAPSFRNLLRLTFARAELQTPELSFILYTAPLCIVPEGNIPKNTDVRRRNVVCP